MAQQSQIVLGLIIVVLCAGHHVVVGQDPSSNIESIEIEPAKASLPAPDAAPAPVASEGAHLAATSPQSSGQQPIAANPQSGLTGTTTQHKGPDGSIITVTKFNGELPANAFPQFNQLYNPWGIYGAVPYAPYPQGPYHGAPYPQARGIRARP